MKIHFTCLLVVCLIASQTFSQFSIAYAPANWTTTLSAGSTGSVNTSGAPGSITLTGSDGAMLSNADVDFTITAIASGIWSFSWNYITNDSDNDPQYDIAGVLINGVFTQLTANTLGLTTQSGTFTGGSVTAGTVIGFRLRATDNVFGNATFTISNFSPPGGVLPVNFVNFTATRKGETVHLDWATATETSSDYFEVQRSSDARSFVTLSTVNAQGNSSGLVNYSAIDNAPLPGIGYYRIREVDIDGRELFTKILAVNFGSSTRMRLYPNPAFNTVTIEPGISRDGQAIVIKLLSSSGQLISSRNWNPSGTGQNKMVWDISKLVPGIYFFRVQGESTNFSFVKQ